MDAEAGIAILLKLDVVLFCHVHESSCTRLQKELAYIPTMHFHSGHIPSMLRPFSGGAGSLCFEAGHRFCPFAATTYRSFTWESSC